MNDASGKFATGNFATCTAGVVDTRGKLPLTFLFFLAIHYCELLPFLLKFWIIFMLDYVSHISIEIPHVFFARSLMEPISLDVYIIIARSVFIQKGQ